MKYLEIIELRSSVANAKELEEKLHNLIQGISQRNEVQKVKIYGRLNVDNDLSIHILHDTDALQKKGSELGLYLSSALKEYGLVNYSIWLEKNNQ